MEPDHIPPPPYSETDIYSNSGGHTVILTPATSQADNASVAGRPPPSVASSVDEPIDTPPYSPASSLHQNQVVGEEVERASISTSSATAYFETRPVRSTASTTLDRHFISLTAKTQPKDLSYPQSLQAKDVNEQDWATFLNYLLPEHVDTTNYGVADRKMKAELIDERMSRLTLGQDSRSMTDLAQVDAQLSPLRQPQSPRGTDTMSTLAEWNEGFFKPRGVHICLRDGAAEETTQDSDRVNEMPGAWIPSEQDNLPQSSRNNPAPETRRSWGPFGGLRANSEGFRMGPIQADNDGFRVGNMLVADQNGFRLGGRRGFIADSNGVSLGGRMIGRREYYENENPRGRYGRHRGRSHSHGRYARNRGRSASTSSSLSSSSSSSSDSDSSVGSIPEYKDLKDQQLPVVKQSLLKWLSHPDQPVTRDSVQSMKRDIKAAKKDFSRSVNQDLPALRQEVKELVKKFKDVVRAQKKQRKEARKERRAAKKSLKRERRAAKKEAKESRRNERSFSGRGGRGRGGLGGHPFAGRQAGLPTPCVPGMPSPPGIQIPGMRPGFPFGGGFGPFGRGNHIPPNISARGWSFSHPNVQGPFGYPVPPVPGSFPHSTSASQPGVFNPFAYPFPFSTPSPAVTAEQLHSQALQMDAAVKLNEDKAVELRTQATERDVVERDRLKLLNNAMRLEEEAEKYRREGERLRAEAVEKDGELARELEEEHGGHGGEDEGLVWN